MPRCNVQTIESEIYLKEQACILLNKLYNIYLKRLNLVALVKAIDDYSLLMQKL